MSEKSLNSNSQEFISSKKIKLEKTKPIFKFETPPRAGKLMQCISIPASENAAIKVGRSTPNFQGMLSFSLFSRLSFQITSVLISAEKH